MLDLKIENEKTKKIIQNLLYLVAIALTTLLIVNHDYSKKGSKEVVKVPQEYMRNVHVTHFTEEGKVKDNLVATYWGYLPDEGICSFHPFFVRNAVV